MNPGAVMKFSLQGCMHEHDNAPSLFKLTQFAREMRKAPTRSEALLWARHVLPSVAS